MPPEAQHRLVDHGSESSVHRPATRAFAGSGERREFRVEVLDRRVPTLGASGLAQARARNLASWLESSSGSTSFSYDMTFAHAVLPEPVTMLFGDPEAVPTEDREKLSPLMRRRLAALTACIEAEPVEDGMRHLGERLITELVSAHETDEFVTGVLSLAPGSLKASILRLIGRVRVEDPAVRRRIVEASLGSADVQVRDAAVQAVESWEDAGCIELLQQHEEPVGWLAAYAQDVIRDLEG